jgi:hypothetical protein
MIPAGVAAWAAGATYRNAIAITSEKIRDTLPGLHLFRYSM